MGRHDKPLPFSTTFMLGVALRVARQDAGITLTAHAATLGYSKGYVSAIERVYSILRVASLNAMWKPSTWMLPIGSRLGMGSTLYKAK